MTAPSLSRSDAPAALVPPVAGEVAANPASDPRTAQVQQIIVSLGELSDDASVPRNVRRGAQCAKEELLRPRVALDVRISGAVSVLDELANDPNIPTHGRTAIWSIISSLESFP